MRHGDIVDFDITEALQMKKQFNKELMISPLKFPFNLLEIFDGKSPAGITPSRTF